MSTPVVDVMHMKMSEIMRSVLIMDCITPSILQPLAFMKSFSQDDARLIGPMGNMALSGTSLPSDVGSNHKM